MEGARWWFCTGRKGKKVKIFGCCVHVCSVLSKKGKKGHRWSFVWSSAYSLHFKTEDYIGQTKSVKEMEDRRWENKQPLGFPRGILVKMTLFKKTKHHHQRKKPIKVWMNSTLPHFSAVALLCILWWSCGCILGVNKTQHRQAPAPWRGSDGLVWQHKHQNPTPGELCSIAIGRVDIEGLKGDVVMNGCYKLVIFVVIFLIFLV